MPRKRKEREKKRMHARESLGMKEFKSITHAARGKVRSAKKKRKGRKKQTKNVSNSSLDKICECECEWTRGLGHSTFLSGL